MDRNIVNILLNSGFHLDEGLLDWFSLLVLEKRRLSTLSVDVLCLSAQSDWTVVITAFAFYTAGAGQKGLGCLSRDCHCHNITYWSRSNRC